jgi:hypothetical protein
MAEATAPVGVSLSRPLGGETPRHPTLSRGDGGTPAETCDLIALARRVLNRDTWRDKGRDTVSHVSQEAAPPAPAVEKMLMGEACGGVWGDTEAERAAIIEHDGCIPREWAEGFARLAPDRAPADVPLKRWGLFIDDVGRFLDSPFCAVAAALGWGPLDLFGCDRDRPFARIDQAGLLWLLNGERLVALSENTATIETDAGVRQTYQRLFGGEARASAWELSGGDKSR